MKSYINQFRLTVFICISFSSLVFGQTTIIVKNSLNDEPVSNAKIEADIDGTIKIRYTDERGRYVINTGKAKSSVKLSISASDFIKKDIVLNSNEPLLEVKMDPDIKRGLESSEDEAAVNIFDSDDWMIYLLIGFIISIQIVVFSKTNRKISKLRKSISSKSNFYTEKIIIDESRLNDDSLDQLLSDISSSKLQDANAILDESRSSNDRHQPVEESSMGIEENENWEEVSEESVGSKVVEVKGGDENVWVKFEKDAVISRIKLKNFKNYYENGWRIVNDN